MSVIDKARLDRWLASREREVRQYRGTIDDPLWRQYVLGYAHAYAKVRSYVQQQGMKRTIRKKPLRTWSARDRSTVPATASKGRS